MQVGARTGERRSPGWSEREGRRPAEEAPPGAFAGEQASLPSRFVACSPSHGSSPKTEIVGPEGASFLLSSLGQVREDGGKERAILA